MQKSAVAFVFTLVTLVGVAQPARAFGLRTHLWIAQRIVEELKTSCEVTIDSKRLTIPADVCQSIRNNPTDFLSGALGPDAYPDLVTGQVTTHPGVDGDWQTRDWLRHLHKSSRPGAEAAFTAGFLVHAAGDTFAHTYVNAYSGDIFLLGKERAVERRHFVLEKYIDYRLPAGEPDPNSLTVPAEFLASHLILNDDAARVAKKSGYAPHIFAMNEVYKNVDRLAKALDDLENGLAGPMVDVSLEGVKYGQQLATGEAQLATADDALALHEKQLIIEKKLLDEAERAFKEADGFLQDNVDAINLWGLREKAANEAVNAAENAAKELNNGISDLEKAQSHLENEVLKVGEQICKTIQEEVCGHCGWDPLCHVTCHFIDKEECALSGPAKQLLQVKDQLQGKRKELTDVGITLAAEKTKAAIALQERLKRETANAALKATREAARLAYDAARLRYEAELKATQDLRTEVQRLQVELARLRKLILDTDALKAELKRLLAQSDILSGYAKNWRTGIEVSSREYIKAGLEVSKLLIKGEPGVFSEYSEWLPDTPSSTRP